MQREGTQWWWYLNRFWKDEDNINAADVSALVLERELKKQKTLESARTYFLRLNVFSRFFSPDRDASPFPSPSAMRSGDATRVACVYCGSR